MKKDSLISKLVIYLLLCLLAVTIIVPVGWVFLASVKENSEFYGNPWQLPQAVHFQNFTDAWEKAGMGDYFFNSILVTGLALLILLVVALPAAYVLGRYKFITGNFIRIVFMGGLFVNVSYIVVPIFLMLVDADRSVREILGSGVFLNNKIVLAVIYAATALPFTIYLLSSYFVSIPKEYEEAAFVDGAGYTRTMLQVIAPMAKPSIITVILFNFLSFWNEYIMAMTLMTDPNNRTLPVGLMNLMKAQNAAAQYGQMYAGLVIVMLPTLILYMCVHGNLTKGMTVGGLKG
ncbi:MAG: carbohydrate ABC transporter permease [Lachnospiraceae bacterium]